MPSLVLLPGMDGTGDLFESFRVALRDAFEVTVVRTRQVGDSWTIAVSIAASRPRGLAGVTYRYRIRSGTLPEILLRISSKNAGISYHCQFENFRYYSLILGAANL
jgi:hypothetical protein